MSTPEPKCTTCKRSPKQVNNEFSECSHAACPHRRQAWSERPEPVFKGPWPKNTDTDPKPL